MFNFFDFKSVKSKGFFDSTLMVFLGVIVILMGLLLPNYFNLLIGDVNLLFWGIGIMLIIGGMAMAQG